MMPSRSRVSLMTWPNTMESPIFRKLRRRSCTGSIPIRSAQTSMCRSMANSLWGPPKPRKAPGGGVLVAMDRPWMRAWGML